jgi:hypothetical protein
MSRKFKKIAPRLVQSEYITASGEKSVLYYARFKCKLKRKRRLFALGPDLSVAKNELKILEGRNAAKEDFDKDRLKPTKENSAPMTWGEWSAKYPEQEGIKNKQSLNGEKGMIRLHLKPFFRKSGIGRRHYQGEPY